MEDKRVYEQLWREAQSVEIPKELEPEQMQARLGTHRQGIQAQKERGHKKTTRVWLRTCGSRVAAAMLVLMLSAGVYGVARLQPAEQTSDCYETLTEEKPSEDEGSIASAYAAAESTEEVVVARLGDYRLAESYEEVSEALGRLYTFREETQTNAAMAEDGAADLSQSGMEAAAGEAADAMNRADLMQEKQESEYSTTNLQVQGVDESDIVKTDGHYIYIVSDETVRIVDVSGHQVRQLGSITPERAGNLDTIREMYLAENRLVLIMESEKSGLSPAELQDRAQADCAWSTGGSCVRMLTYDVSTPAGAKLLGSFEMDGAYQTSRKIGDCVYLVTDYMPYPYRWYGCTDYVTKNGVQPMAEEGDTPEQPDAEKLLPKLQGQTIPADRIYLSERVNDRASVIASVELSKPEELCDSKMIFSGYATLYMTKNSMIFYDSYYSETADALCTGFTKFRVQDGRIAADCAESVRGMIEDTFAVHESGAGDVYVLTTDDSMNETQNRLYVLDEKLKIKGSIEHIADGERVYAARFVDEIGYFVTYRNTDPLFTVDFSDPAHPTLIGELEIPGFSDYLQFYDDTHLVGVGEERVGGNSEFVAMKLSLYDISDPTDVKESAKLLLDGSRYAPAANNYKALLADADKHLIAFVTVDETDAQNHTQLTQRIFTVENGAISAQVTDPVCGDEAAVWELADACRSLYIGDRLYLICEDTIYVYDMTDSYERLDSYVLTA